MHRTQAFVSYSHADLQWNNRLMTHLAVLDYEGPVDVWSDTELAPGADWYKRIQEAMDSSKVTILVITADYLASMLVQTEKVPQLLDRNAKLGLRVFPLIAKPCAWKLVNWLENFEVRPKNGIALSTLEEHRIEWKQNCLGPPPPFR
jgi:hypothetical protein